MTNLCKYCKGPIQWARHKVTGRPNPLNLTPSAEGNILLDRQRMIYEVLSVEERADAREQNVVLYVAHSATCLNRPKTAQARATQPGGIARGR